MAPPAGGGELGAVPTSPAPKPSSEPAASRSKSGLSSWLDAVKAPELLAPLAELGVEDRDDLALLESEDIDTLCKPLKKVPARKFRDGVALRKKKLARASKKA